MVIYETRGKAREYCELAANLYKGCGHGCTYCYAPAATYTDREAFSHPTPRKDIIGQMSRDLTKMNGDQRPILLCFTCDPYQPIDRETGLTRQAIEVTHFYGKNVKILTKGGQRAERDLDLLGLGDWFGVTLTCSDDAESLKWEPQAALPQERIDTLRHAHELGIKTWASFEPVLDTVATLQLIQRVSPFCDQIKVGKLNHHPLAQTIDWRQFAHDAVELLDSLGNDYYIKDDLRKYL